ncbi:hypothetical protein N7475_001137 [Penicillium sp. IBT 31633x]|nr:hypothetical protein N7475_001137 [Penicillium sp. IBT 31633x]
MSPTKSTKIFPITTFISDLPANLFPQSLPSPNNGPVSGRLVIVGDVHGMRKSLEALLDKIDFDKINGDHLILVGDLVNKGPDSPGVVDLAIKLGASAVRGNHENAVLNAAAEINATRSSLLHSNDSTGNPAISENLETDLPGDTGRDVGIPDKCVPATVTSIGMGHSTATYSTALSLSAAQIDWLAALPLILRAKLPRAFTPTFGDTLIVAHAGLAPSISLEDQDPHAIMHMRSLVRSPGDDDGVIPAEAPGDESWVTEWDRWQDRLASKTTVVFGHDAKRRLQRSRYAIGLDSACLYGHQLSALVIAASDGNIEHRVVQVECADMPVAPVLSVEQGDKKATL